jgi:glucose dehydrogenase
MVWPLVAFAFVVGFQWRLTGAAHDFITASLAGAIVGSALILFGKRSARIWRPLTYWYDGLAILLLVLFVVVLSYSRYLPRLSERWNYHDAGFDTWQIIASGLVIIWTGVFLPMLATNRRRARGTNAHGVRS